MLVSRVAALIFFLLSEKLAQGKPPGETETTKIWRQVEMDIIWIKIKKTFACNNHQFLLDIIAVYLDKY